ncbi:AAA ATPase domain protein [Mycobacterium ulcerans str. Harvey]|uniref:AAA ATPase domain protein n=1 Tax=Mycobacterium ulcerans str. Harvey TaxID=1299332 RepID=A0ABN0QPQ9_MYCUL|nr:AAA ATPase domain protein [Mycobacterium ulcerans str. Harvey]
MEAVAAPETVMLGESTARLVEGAAVLGEPQLVHIKGVEAAVPAWQLLGVVDQYWQSGPAPATLVGREWELDTLTTMLDRSIAGRGSVVTLVGRAGIGKTRLAREAARVAKNLGVTVFSTFCESHATDIPFRAVTRLLRAAAQVSRLDDATARVRVRAIVPDGDPQDLLLLYDLLGIADPRVELPKIAPEARRRRLAALINAVQLARAQPAVYVIEDAHWMDEASESMVAEFLTVIPQTHSIVLVTYRPDYRGALRGVRGAQSIALGPLSDAETSALIAELLGPIPPSPRSPRSSPRVPPATPFSPRRSSASSPNAGCWWGSVAATRAPPRPTTRSCRPRCRQPSARASTGSARPPSRLSAPRPSSDLASAPSYRPGHRTADRGADQRGTR